MLSRRGHMISWTMVILIFFVMFAPYLAGAPAEVHYQSFFLAMHMSLFVLLMTEKRKYMRYAFGELSPILAIANFYWRGFHTDIAGLLMMISLSFALLNCFNASPD